jgi:excinuclease UvrABC nuclease subunit
MKIRFPDIEVHVPTTAGLYEIYTDQGIALKVGIAVNLLKRLKSHRASRDSGLRW